MKLQKMLNKLISAAFLLSASVAANAIELPRLQFVMGDVQAIAKDGSLRPVEKGDTIWPGERLITGDGGMAQLRVFKQGIIALRENSDLKLDRPDIGNDFSIKLEKGIIRTVTAMANRAGHIQIKTPGAKISVKAGDTLTGVGLTKKGHKETVNRVQLGEVKIKTPKLEKLALIGRSVSISDVRPGIKILEKTPDRLRLTVPALPTITKKELAAVITRPALSTDPKVTPGTPLPTKPSAPLILTKPTAGLVKPTAPVAVLTPAVKPAVPVIAVLTPITKPVVPTTMLAPIVKPVVPITVLAPIVKPTVPVVVLAPIIKPIVPIISKEPIFVKPVIKPTIRTIKTIKR